MCLNSTNAKNERLRLKSDRQLAAHHRRKDLCVINTNSYYYYDS